MAPSAVLFTETQWFHRSWRWVTLGLNALIIIPLAFALTKPQGVKAVLITLPLWLGTLIGLWLMKLTVRVDALGIHYQYIPFLNRWRHWPWSEFRRVFLRTYSPLGDYGGWGIKGFPGDLVYNVWGSDGLQLIFQSGDKLLLGTQQPEELRSVLMALRVADPTRPITASTSSC